MDKRSGEKPNSPIPDSPIPDSPFSPLDMNPPLLDPSMRSESYLYSPRTPNRRRRPQWHPNFLPIQEQESHTPRTRSRSRRTVKGKWGSRFCRNQSCKRQFHPRPPPPPPPPPHSAIVVRGGTRKTKSKKYKNRK